MNMPCVESRVDCILFDLVLEIAAVVSIIAKSFFLISSLNSSRWLKRIRKLFCGHDYERPTVACRKYKEEEMRELRWPVTLPQITVHNDGWHWQVFYWVPHSVWNHRSVGTSAKFSMKRQQLATICFNMRNWGTGKWNNFSSVTRLDSMQSGSTPSKSGSGTCIFSHKDLLPLREIADTKELSFMPWKCV